MKCLVTEAIKLIWVWQKRNLNSESVLSGEKLQTVNNVTSNVTSGRKPLDAMQTGSYDVSYGVQLRGALISKCSIRKELTITLKCFVTSSGGMFQILHQSESTRTNLKKYDVMLW